MTTNTATTATTTAALWATTQLDRDDPLGVLVWPTLSPSPEAALAAVAAAFADDGFGDPRVVGTRRDGSLSVVVPTDDDDDESGVWFVLSPVAAA